MRGMCVLGCTRAAGAGASGGGHGATLLRERAAGRRGTRRRRLASGWPEAGRPAGCCAQGAARRVQRAHLPRLAARPGGAHRTHWRDAGAEGWRGALGPPSTGARGAARGRGQALAASRLVTSHYAWQHPPALPASLQAAGCDLPCAAGMPAASTWYRHRVGRRNHRQGHGQQRVWWSPWAPCPSHHRAQTPPAAPAPPQVASRAPRTRA